MYGVEQHKKMESKRWVSVFFDVLFASKNQNIEAWVVRQQLTPYTRPCFSRKLIQPFGCHDLKKHSLHIYIYYREG